MKTIGKLFLVMGLVGALLVACSDSGNNGKDMGTGDDMEVKPDLSMTEQPDLAPACFTNPTTHIMLINACTSADFVDKMPFYPTLAPNGQLPSIN